MVDFQGLTIFFFIWLMSNILLRILFKNRKSLLPPSPRALPIIGHLHLLAPLPHQALYKLSNRYGPLIHIFLGSIPCVVASSPEMAKEFLKTHELTVSDRPETAAVNYLTYGSQDFFFGPYGPYWKLLRKLSMTHLLGGRALDLLQSVRSDEIKCFIELLSRKAKCGETVVVGGELIRLANNVISRMTMNKRCSENEDDAGEIKKVVHEIAEISGKFNLSDSIWFCKNLDLQGFKKRLKGVRDRYNEMMDKIIQEHLVTRSERKKNGDGSNLVKDLLDVLLDVSEDESSDIRLTKMDIKAFILAIFIAGTDTSAFTIEWALAELINHPSIMKKAIEEIESVVGKNRLVEESDIVNLPYLQAIVKETLRLHPTGPLILRESSEDCTIAGYQIPAKTRLFINVWAIGRDPNYWENAFEFGPERFVSEEGNRNSQLDVRGQHFQLLPFGSGRRGCPGTSLALQTVQTTLAAMIQCFDWKVCGEWNGTVEMEEGPGLTIPMAHPLVCIPVARLNPYPSE